MDRKVTKSQAGGVELIEFSILPEHRDALREEILRIHATKPAAAKRNRLLRQAVQGHLPGEILDEIRDYYQEIIGSSTGPTSIYHIHNLPVADESMIPKGMNESSFYRKGFIVNEVTRGILLDACSETKGKNKISVASLVRRKRDDFLVSNLDWHADNYPLSSLAAVTNKGRAKTKFANLETALKVAGIANSPEEIDEGLILLLTLIEIRQPKTAPELAAVLDYDPSFKKQGFALDLVKHLAKVWPPVIKRYSVEAVLEGASNAEPKGASCLFWPNHAIYHRADIDDKVYTASLKAKDITRVAVFQGIERD